MTTLLEQQLMDSLEIVKRDKLIRMLQEENRQLRQQLREAQVKSRTEFDLSCDGPVRSTYQAG